MVKESTKAAVNQAESSEQDTLEKIRWSLRQRLCEHMRRLNGDLFDELDDFLFNSVQPEELAEGSAQLKLIREFRNKKQLFEEQFLASIDGALQSTLVPRNENVTLGERHKQELTTSSAYEKMEVDLALERMQRKAFKHYAPRISELGNSDRGDGEGVSDQVIPESRDILIKNTLRALAESHRVFRVSLENRLVFLKLFEKHFLLQMDKLYQDVIGIINNKDNRKFVERLYSSSTSIRNRRERSRINRPESGHGNSDSAEPLSGAHRVKAQVKTLVDDWCSKRALPGYVETMLRNDWQNVMFLMGLNKGVESREWCEAKETVESLLTLITGGAAGSASDLDIDELKKRLHQGFELAQKPEAEQQDFFAALQDPLIRGGTTSSDGGKNAEKSNAEESTSLISSGDNAGAGTSSPGRYVAVSEAGRKILNSDDLDDFVALLSDDQEQAMAELDEEAISMDYYLNMVDTMKDDAAAEILIGSAGPRAGAKGRDVGKDRPDDRRKCHIRKSTSLENSYQVLDEKDRVLLTRGRVGLAVSLRAGEIRLEGQQDFQQGQPGDSQLVVPDLSSQVRQTTVH